MTETVAVKVDESRREFEAWFKSEIIETPDFVFNEFDEQDGEYIIGEDDNEELYLNIQAMFMAWTASRAALVVELPSLKQSETGDRYQWSDGVFHFKHDTTGILRAAGITVKGDS